MPHDMKSSAKPKATEERLDEIRKPPVKGRQVSGSIDQRASSPQIRDAKLLRSAGLKAPVWTWEVPLYFFLGGIAGVSACMAFVAQLFHGDPRSIRFCFWMGLIGAAICPDSTHRRSWADPRVS